MKSRYQLTLLSLALLTFFVVLIVVNYITTQRQRSLQTEALDTFSLKSENLSPESFIESEDAMQVYNLYAEDSDAALFTLEGRKVSDVIKFLQNNPTVTLEGETRKELVIDSIENIEFLEKLYDSDFGGELFNVQTFDKSNEHFFFVQSRCGNIPVFGSSINVHMNGNNDIYSVSGALAEGQPECLVYVSKDDASAKAIEYFVEYRNSKEDSTGVAGTPSSQFEADYIFSDRLAGNDSDAMYRTYAFKVCDDAYCAQVLVDVQNGEVRAIYPLTFDVKNRSITFKNSSGSDVSCNETTCPVSGTSTVHQSVNKTFGILGTIWDYYNTNFQRDSYSNGETMRAVHYNDNINVQGTRCSGYAWFDGSTIHSCYSMAEVDVISHEFQHGVTAQTAKLVYSYEHGAINESLSDVFASMIDNNDWLMGEDSVIGAIRSMENPPSKQQPDDLFSSKYYCGSQDNGGVHINSGVFNKAYYLMSDGGTQNGCTVSGIGRDKAGAVVYKAISTYLRNQPYGNYRDLYDAMVQACGDVYDPSGSECANITAAMQAVRMDQQKSGRNVGPKCTYGSQRSYAAKPATCSGATQPTAAPTNTQPTSSPTSPASPTSQPTSGQPTTIPTPRPTDTSCLIKCDKNGDGNVTDTDIDVVAQTDDTLAQFCKEACVVATRNTPGDGNDDSSNNKPSPTYAPPARKTKVEAPLLSVLSASSSFAGDVTITQSQNGYSIQSQVTGGISENLNILMQRIQEESGQDLAANFADKLKTRLRGTFTIELGDLVRTGNGFEGTYTTSEDLRRSTIYEVYLPKEDTYSDLPVLVGDVSDLYLTGDKNDPGRGDVILNIQLRLQGVISRPKHTEAQIFKIGVGGGNLSENIYQDVLFVPQPDGSWKGKAVFDIPERDDYRVLIKGPHHAQKRYCENAPTEEKPGYYTCGDKTLTLKLGNNSIDLRGVTQVAGDINQDGRTNALDILMVRSRIGKQTADDVYVADINHDGIVNAVDDSLILFTLTNQIEQN